MIERRSDVTGNMDDAKRRLLKRTQTMRDFAIYQRTDGPIQGRRPSPKITMPRVRLLETLPGNEQDGLLDSLQR